MKSQDVLTELVIQQIYSHAEAVYPEECCGFVFANGTVHLGTNIQDQLHERQPEIYRRTAANGYTFSVADTVLLNQSLSGSNPVAVIYHSHPDVGAYFSREDEEKALFMGRPILPISYLVIDVRNTRALGASLFEWSGVGFTCSNELVNRPTHG